MNVKRLWILGAILALATIATAEEASIETLKATVAQENWAEAKAQGETLATNGSDNAEVYSLLGKALVQLKENKPAVEAYEKAVSLSPDNADYYADFGYALIQRGQEMNMFQAGPTYMKAMDQYKQAVKLNPDHLGAHIGLARYYMHAPAIGGGSMKKAKEHADEIARINPYQGHIEYALIAQKENRLDDAESEFQKAVAIKGDEAWVYFELARLQQASGKMLEAKASYEKTLELNPNHEGAKSALEAFN